MLAITRTTNAFVTFKEANWESRSDIIESLYFGLNLESKNKLGLRMRGYLFVSFDKYSAISLTYLNSSGALDLISSSTTEYFFCAINALYI